MGVSTTSAIRRCPVFVWLFSSIGKKTVVALTGIVLALFVTGHLAGNMTFYFGPEILNAYAKHLQSLGPFLWVIRLCLLTILLLHIGFILLLVKENHGARPQKYHVKKHVQSTAFARTMRASGSILLAFIIFHILHFTACTINPAFKSLEYTYTSSGETVHNVYAMVVMGFSVPWVSAFYILSMFLLAFHLSHGIPSLFQTLGLSNKFLRGVFEIGGRAFAWLIFVGYTSIPVSILFFHVGKEALK